MKILHISDLHLGKIVNGFPMIEDQRHILDQVLTVIDTEQIDILVIAGDIYDRALAPSDAIEVWSDFLEQIIKYDIQTFIINGNHDSAKRINFASDIFKRANIHIASDEQLVHSFKVNNINIHLLPFLNLEQGSHIIGEKISDFTTLKSKSIESLELDLNETNIIVDHSYILTGGYDLESSSSERPLALGGNEFTKGEVFKDFDLVLAGHIHRHAHLQPNIYYSGSILPYSIGEANNKNGYYIHTITDVIESTYHHFDLLHPIRKLELYINDIDKYEYSEDYIVITLLDSGQIVNPLERLRIKFPNLMQIDRSFKQINLEQLEAVDDNSIDLQFADFYNLNSEQEISDKQLEYFRQLAINNGGDNETD